MEENPFEAYCQSEDNTGFFLRELRSLEFRAYASILSAFRAGGELDEEKRGVLSLMRQTLNISELRHKSEVRRVATNPRLAIIANKIHGYNTNQEWLDEGFCESPYGIGIARFPLAKAPSRTAPVASPEVEKLPLKREKGGRIVTAHDFGRAIKTEKPVDPSLSLPNGWVTNAGGSTSPKIKSERSDSSSSSESESSVDISYASLKKKGRIRLQKRSMLKLKKMKQPLLKAPKPAPPAPVPQTSPDVADAVSPVKRDTTIPSRRGRGAKRKIMLPSGKIKLAPVPQKQMKLREEEQETGAEPTVDHSFPSRGRGLARVRGRGSRGGVRRGGGMTNGRGRIRLSMKSNQRVLKIKTPQKNVRLKKQQSKRKQLDEVRVELKSDDSDKERDSEKRPEPLKRSSSTESVNKDGSPSSSSSSSSSSESELDSRKEPSELPRPQLQSPPIPKPPISSSESDNEIRREIQSRRESSPAIIPEKPKTPPKVQPRSPLPAPVFSTSLNSVNKKRPKILNSFPPISEAAVTALSTASSLATASSLTRRPPIFSSAAVPGPKPPGILPQRKAQPHILVNSKAQRNIANTSSSMAGSFNPSSAVPLMTSSVIQQQQQGSPSSKAGFNLPNFPPVVSSLGGMGTPVSYGPMKTSQGANIIFLQKAGGGALSTSTPVVGSSATIVTSSASNNPVGSTGPSGMPMAPVNMQQLPSKNSPRAVILRRANLPRQGNVMILDVQKNQVVSTNQVPQFLQTARILNSPAELALVANLQNQSGGVPSVRKTFVSSAQVSSAPSTSHVTVSASSGGGGAIITTTSSAGTNAITLPNHGIPLRFPINQTQLQQLQQQQQQSTLKAKRVGRAVFSSSSSPRDLKTVIRVSAVPVQKTAVLPVPTTVVPSPMTTEAKDISPVEQGEPPAEEAEPQPMEADPVSHETCYEEEVVTSGQEPYSSTNNVHLLESSAAADMERLTPLQEFSNNNTTVNNNDVERRTELVVVGSGSCDPSEIVECNSEEFVTTEIVELNGSEGTEALVTETVGDFLVATTEEVSSGPALTEDIFQTALKSSGLDFSDPNFVALADEGNCANLETVYAAQDELTGVTQPEFPYRVPDIASEERITTQQ